MKILITGGAGFIGSHIADAYLAEGHEVCIVDDLSTGHRENLPNRVRLYECDIRDPSLAKIFEHERPDVVNHQAAKANVRESFDRPVFYADVNVVGSVNVLECCRQFGVRRVIYASTGGAVYGEPESVPVAEDHPINPLDPYGASKHHVEHYLSLYQRNFGISYAALRYANVYGPRQDPHGEAGVIAIFAEKMLNGEAPIINGSGNQERDFVHVSDVARASVLALDRDDSHIVNLGSGVGTSVNSISRHLAASSGYTGNVRHGPAKSGEVSRIILDARRAKSVLGWQATIDLDRGIRSTVASFRSASVLERPAEEVSTAKGALGASLQPISS